MSLNSKRTFFGILLGLAFIWVINYAFNYAIQEENLEEVSGTLSTNLEFNEKVNNKTITVYLNEDQFKYKTVGIGYEAFKVEDAKENLEIGSVVTMLVEKGEIDEELGVGLTKTIRFYSLKSEDTTYLSLNDYNKEKSGNRWAILVIWIISFGGYLYDLWFKKRPITEVKT